MNDDKKDSRGFTLIELLLTIGIIAILAGVVLVSLGGFAQRSRTAKAQALMSSAVSAMLSCWGNSREVKVPASNAYICKNPGVGGADLDRYGRWPHISSDLNNRGYVYTEENVSTDVGMQANWHFSFGSPTAQDNVKICCNSTMNSCGPLASYATTCDDNSTW